MGDIREIDINVFMDLFMAICYREEQRLFNKLDLEKQVTYGYLPKYLPEFKAVDVYNEMEEILEEMEEDGIIEPVEGRVNVYRVTNRIDFINIIRNNIENLKLVENFFFSILEHSYPSIIVVPSRAKEKSR